MEKTTEEEFWDSRYREDTATWDLGEISTPLKEYFDQLTDKNLKILIPGCGNGHEAAYLFEKGFTEVYVIDLSQLPLDNFAKRVPDFPKDHLLKGDFFEHQGSYDLIIEQTFFCAINPSLRKEYVQKMYSLLKPGGKLAGLLFDCDFEKEGPPFGGKKSDYHEIFSEFFEFKHFEKAYNSIEPRKNRELFIVCLRK